MSKDSVKLNYKIEPMAWCRIVKVLCYLILAFLNRIDEIISCCSIIMFCSYDSVRVSVSSF